MNVMKGSAQYLPLKLLRQGRSPESGITLLECLVAIIVMASIGAAIAPALVLSVATRVQSQRAEQALQLAQSEVDRVRTAIERSGIEIADDSLPPDTGDETAATAVTGPTSAADVDAGKFYTDATNKARNLDVDDDDEADFAVQTYITNVVENADGQVKGFDMGVRVYDVSAFEEAGGGALSTDNASLGLTSGEGDRVNRPLAVLYSNVLVSDEGTTMCDYLPSDTKSDTRGCN